MLDLLTDKMIRYERVQLEGAHSQKAQKGGDLISGEEKRSRGARNPPRGFGHVLSPAKQETNTQIGTKRTGIR